MEQFISALTCGDEEGILAAPKSDIHTHAGRSGHPAFISGRTGIDLPEPPHCFESLQHMHEWYTKNIKSVCDGIEGCLLRWEAGFAEAARNNIVRFAPSFTQSEIVSVGGMERFVNILDAFRLRYCPDISFEPELAFTTYCDIDEELAGLDEVLGYGYFRSVDLNSGENIHPFSYYLPLYRKADEYGLVKKAHVGEFGTADDIVRAAEKLGLDEIHHGIAAAKSDKVMKFLADRDIQLNICPSSNVMLKVVPDMKHHPIKTLVRNGVPVTINTDDLLIFGRSLDKEYLMLYREGVLSAKELDEIHLRGIRAAVKENRCADA